MPPPPPPDDSGWSQPPPPDPLASAPQAGTGGAAYEAGASADLAGAGSRLGARIIDAVIVMIVAIPAFVIVAITTVDDLSNDNTVDTTSGAFLATILLVTVAAMIYEVSMTALRGQTLGKMAVRFRVVDAEASSLPGWGPAFLRWLVPGIIGLIGSWIPFVGLLVFVIYASLLWDQRRQGWHDKAAKTLVVKA